jgi:hypothetical protein
MKIKTNKCQNIKKIVNAITKTIISGIIKC